MKRIFRVSLVVGLCMTAIVVGAAAAASHRAVAVGDPFVGISAAANATVGSSVVDPATTTLVADASVHHVGGSLGGQTIAQARLLAGKVSGLRTYLIPSSTGDFCLAVQGIGEICHRPLTTASPATFAVFDADGVGGSAPIVFGVAGDHVRSVSFTVAGKKETVPVRRNLFSFVGDPSTTNDDYAAAVADLAGGSTANLGG